MDIKRGSKISVSGSPEQLVRTVYNFGSSKSKLDLIRLVDDSVLIIWDGKIIQGWMPKEICCGSRKKITQTEPWIFKDENPYNGYTDDFTIQFQGGGDSVDAVYERCCEEILHDQNNKKAKTGQVKIGIYVTTDEDIQDPYFFIVDFAGGLGSIWLLLGRPVDEKSVTISRRGLNASAVR